MKHVRPHHVFDLLKTERFADRVASFVLPGKLNPILDSVLLTTLARVVNPRTYFEFGTYLGTETLNIALNTSAQIWTLDLNEPIELDAPNATVSAIHFANRDRLAFFATPEEARITRLLGDSTKFDFTPFLGKMDMIFVDGGHELPTLSADTKNAFNLLSNRVPRCIVWHDYGNALCPQVADYLESVEEVVHVEESMIAYYLVR